MSRVLQPCGTQGAYQRHLRNSEVPCRACLNAVRDLRRQQRAAKRQQREASS